MSILGNAMDASMLRHEILADNIANIDTPGFKRSDVSFQRELQRALDNSPHIELNRAARRHFETSPGRNPQKVHGRAYAEVDTWTRNDKNNVDPEVEMSHIAQNTMYFQAVASRVAAGFKGLTSIVQRTPVG
jgi:flagellar basal-body rod protein FlgB